MTAFMPSTNQDLWLVLFAGFLGLIIGWYLTRSKRSLVRVRLAQRQTARARTALLAATQERDRIAARLSQTQEELLIARTNLVEEDAIPAPEPPPPVPIPVPELSPQELDRSVEDLMATFSDLIDDPVREQQTGPEPDAVRPPESDVETPDDLTEIKGIGPGIERTLFDLGIRQFAQIAAWSQHDIAWISDHLGAFRNRVIKDDWVMQARRLVAERSHNFSNKVRDEDFY